MDDENEDLALLLPSLLPSLLVSCVQRAVNVVTVGLKVTVVEVVGAEVA